MWGAAPGRGRGRRGRGRGQGAAASERGCRRCRRRAALANAPHRPPHGGIANAPPTRPAVFLDANAKCNLGKNKISDPRKVVGFGFFGMCGSGFGKGRVLDGGVFAGMLCRNAQFLHPPGKRIFFHGFFLIGE